jgi:hypothetical protein
METLLNIFIKNYYCIYEFLKTSSIKAIYIYIESINRAENTNFVLHFFRMHSPSKGGDPTAGSPTVTLLRLIPSHPPYLRHSSPLRLTKMFSGTDSSHGLTGGVYKVRERIHRIILICDY